MAKIIKEGKLPVKRMTCDYCGCEFEYDFNDLKVVPDGKIIGFYPPISIYARVEPETEDLYYVHCPCCGRRYELSKHDANQLKAENPRKDFDEDVRALARQYGLTITNIEVK